MTPYFVVLLLAVMLYSGYQHGKNKIFLFLAFIILTLLPGLRDMMVGTDTGGYAREFMSIATYNNVSDVLSYFSVEKGWLALNFLISRLFSDYWAIMTATGAITAGCALYSIKRLSANGVLSLFIFITMGYYLQCFAAMRQSAAIAVYMLALPYLFAKDFKKYSIFCIIAALFHQTALVGIPLYFLFTLPVNKKTISLMTGVGLLGGYLLPRILMFASTVEERYGTYLENEGGGEMFTVFYVIITIFFLMQRKNIKEEAKSRYDIMLMMLMLGSVIYLVVTLSHVYGEVSRFAMYFQISVIFLWAELFKNGVRKANSLIYSACIFGSLVYFYVYLSKIGHIAPYILNTTF